MIREWVALSGKFIKEAVVDEEMYEKKFRMSEIRNMCGGMKTMF